MARRKKKADREFEAECAMARHGSANYLEGCLTGLAVGAVIAVVAILIVYAGYEQVVIPAILNAG
jgi:hypothetical protein